MRCLLATLVLFACLAIACGSGDEADPVTGTPASERAERQATVEVQAVQVNQQVQPAQQARQVQQEQQQTGDATEQTPQVQQAQDDGQETEAVDELPAEIVGVHKGLRSERNVLGEPDAPVEIRYFGDFT